jgi:hypothetical protein
VIVGARTPWATLLTQYADNASGDITAERLRNFVQSARPHVAASAPTVTDDGGSGFDAGHAWIDTTGPSIYECLDASAGAAVWALVYPAEGTPGPEGPEGPAGPQGPAGDSHVPDPASEANGRMLHVQAGALEYRDAPSGGGGGDIALADGLVVVKHGANASVARVGAGAVYWQGSVTPSNRQLGDLWLNTSVYD